MALSKTYNPVTPKLQYTLHIFHSKTSPEVRIQSASIYVHKSQAKNHLIKKKNSEARSPVNECEFANTFSAWETKIALNKSPRHDARVSLRIVSYETQRRLFIFSLLSLSRLLPSHVPSGRSSVTGNRLGRSSVTWNNRLSRLVSFSAVSSFFCFLSFQRAGGQLP